MKRGGVPELRVRADASAKIGYGHVLRCLALAQAWRRLGGKVVFWSHALPVPLRAKLTQEGVVVRRLSSSGSTQWLRGARGSWAVLDGYRFGANLQSAARRAGARLVVIDDVPRLPRYDADLVVDPNAGAEWAAYRVPRGAVLGGSRYALLREEFRGRAPRRVRRGVLRLLLISGGADPFGLLERALSELAAVRAGLDVTVVAGPSNPRLARLVELAKTCGHRARVLTQAPSMSALMRRSDLALSAAGGTSWELAVTGVPSILVPVASNQRIVAEAFRGANAALVPDAARRGALARAVRRLAGDAALRMKLSRAASRLVDGRGAARVAKIMLALSRGDAARPRLRRARVEDCADVWQVSNHPAVRANSFSNADISPAAHREWYARALKSSERALFVLAVDGAVCGQVRYDRRVPGEATVSVSVTPPFWGRGLAASALSRSFAPGARAVGVRSVRALILPRNAASTRTFEKAGYRLDGRTVERGRSALSYVRMFNY